MVTQNVAIERRRSSGNRSTKSEFQRIFFKTSHMQENYRPITLKIMVECPFQQDTRKLNKQPPKISPEKYKDFVSL